MKKTLYIQGMTCRHCSKKVAESLKEIGIKAKVNLKENLAIISSKTDINEAAVKEAITKAGYKFTAIL
jgi:copper chaperone CopZ